MKIGVIIQARSGSKRFPKKIYADISGKYTMQRVLESVSKTVLPHKIILAMPEYDKEEVMRRYNSGELTPYIDSRFSFYFGSPDNVLERYYKAANKFEIDLIVRITCDCPLLSAVTIDEMLVEYLSSNYNGFMGNNECVSSLPFPDGTDVEVFPYYMLAESYMLAEKESDLEHVTPFMYRKGTHYNIYPFLNCRPNTMITMKHPNFSFDTNEDYELIKRIAAQYDKHGDLNKALEEV